MGAAGAMHQDDVFIPSFREHGGQLWRGATPVELFLYWGGDERGNVFANAPGDLPNCVPVGSQAPHAAAWHWQSSCARNRAPWSASLAMAQRPKATSTKQ